MTSLLSQIEAEAAANPMGQGCHIKHEGRILLVDGDALAYSTAGNDSTPIGVARHNLLDRVAAAKAIAGASGVKILTTARSSHKGFRFAVARRKPYQGHRQGGHRPKNWEGLRSMLENGTIPDVELTTIAEADDLFGRYATEYGAENVVIHTEDKDMRMVPGWHLDWQTNTMHFVPEGTWELEHNGKVYGRKWFWLQMLQGDTADNIPGLPNMHPDNRPSGRVGPKTAEAMLNGKDEAVAVSWVKALYEQYYGDGWETELLEQGVLLWMRRDRFSAWHNALAEGNPLYSLNRGDNWDAIDTMRQRIKGTL